MSEYYYLKEGDVIEEGDEWIGGGDIWHITEDAGSLFDSKRYSMRYRRKIKEKPMEKCRLSKTEDGSCVCIKHQQCRACGAFPVFLYTLLEVCPCPSKNLPVKSEWDERAERAYRAVYRVRSVQIANATLLKDFKSALRAEGFK